ncbi:unnamed protein product [Rhizopus stolonifer]
MDMIDKRLNDKGKNWRHVFKALLVLDYCLHVGSQNVVLYAKENVYVIRTLKEFQHVDDTGKDVGYNVRQKAKDITLLLMNDERLREERNSRNYVQERMTNTGDYMSDALVVRRGNGEPDVYRNPGYMDEDKDLKKAIEESRRLAEQESRRLGDSDTDLARAIQESEQEAREAERKRREQLDRDNFDNLFAPRATTQASHNQPSFNSFPTQQNFNGSPNPYAQQQQQFTGMSFAEPITAKNPYHSSPNGFNGLQAQMTGFPQTAQMTGNYPQSSQLSGFSQAGFNQATASQNNNGFQQGLQPQMTGYTSGFNQSLQPQMTGFTQMSGFPQTSQMTGTTNPFGQTPLSAQTTGHERLNNMLLNRDDGMDTFGNTGNLRIPHGTGYANSTSKGYGVFSQPIEPQASRNPFGQSGQSGQQNKSLLELMQEQKMQAQMTGYNQSSYQQPSFF